MEENNQNQNVEPNNIPNEEKPKKENNNLRTILYMVLVIIVFIIIVLLLKGCVALRDKSKNQVISINEWASNVWNKCVDPVYWYTVNGTGVKGADINISEVLKNCDKYYEETKNLKVDFEELKDDELKRLLDQVKSQNEVVYPKIKAADIKSEERVDFEEDMDLFYEYQLKLYEYVKNKYIGE